MRLDGLDEALAHHPRRSGRVSFEEVVNPLDLERLLGGALRVGHAVGEQQQTVPLAKRDLVALIPVPQRMTERLTVVLAVGFADMVGFTALSQQASEKELSDVVGRFEDLAYDIVAAGGGRVVKMIGDEVFFVAESAAAGAGIGLQLADTYSSDTRLPDIRVGLSVGPVLPRAGDYLGPAVNIASRLVNLARPGSVLISEQLAEQISTDEDFDLKRLRARNLKGIGRVPSFVLRRTESPARSSESTLSTSTSSRCSRTRRSSGSTA